MSRPLSFSTLALALFIGVCSPTDTLAQQFDPLKAIREKAEKLKKKIECAVNDPACAETPRPTAPDGTPLPPGAAAPAAAPASLDADVTSVALAPMPTGATAIFQTVVSDDGGRAAGVAMKGSRVVVVVDGQEGPAFDQIVGTGPSRGAAAFGPGGRRVAYIGVRAGAKIAVIDGKEGPPFDEIVANVTQGDPDFGRAFYFSKDGCRVAYIGQTTEPERPGRPPKGFTQVVLDGEPGPRYARIDGMIFAGTRHAYVGTREDRKSVLVVDGKEHGASFDGIQQLQGNDEGHIAFIGRRGSSWSVVVDGKEGQAHQHPGEHPSNFSLSPTKARVAYGVMSSRAPGEMAQLYIDGKLVRSADGFHTVVFSPDASRLAAAYVVQREHKVMVDEWTSLAYTDVGLGTLRFSPDSKRFAFVASNGLSSFVVVDGEELAANGIRHFQFSPDGRRFAFDSYAGHGQGWVAVVDGKPGPKLHDLPQASLTFSPDGTRVAYSGSVGIGGSTAVIDGEEHKIPVGAFQPRAVKDAYAWRGVAKRYFVFSPDGKRLAFVNSLHGSGKGVVMLDGQPQVPGNLFSLPVFSHDGKHFAHAVWVDQKWLLALDGKSAPIDGDLYEVPWALAFQDDGSLRYLLVKDDMLHRVVVRPKGLADQPQTPAPAPCSPPAPAPPWLSQSESVAPAQSAASPPATPVQQIVAPAQQATASPAQSGAAAVAAVPPPAQAVTSTASATAPGAAPSAPAQIPAAPMSGAQAADPIARCWLWSNGVQVAFNGDGTMTYGPTPLGQVTGRWRAADPARRSYIFNWPGPIDTAVVSADGTTLLESSPWFVVTSTRASQGTGIVGWWKWPNGVVVMIEPNGTFRAGPIAGTWRAENGAGRAFTLTWPELTNTVTMSDDRQRLDGADQYGNRFAAVKSDTCTGQ